jgi:microsomal dipeptidase-like Zn-dependent dipeptidase
MTAGPGPLPEFPGLAWDDHLRACFREFRRIFRENSVRECRSTRTGATVTLDPDEQAQAIHRTTTVCDVHTHTAGFLPRYAAWVWRRVNRRTMPAEVGLSDVLSCGVHAVVVKAVGDPTATRWWPGSAWRAVQLQLDQIEREMRGAGGLPALTADDIRRGHRQGRLSVVLGLEGADAIGTRLDRLDQLRARGVRIIVPVHLGHNQLGTTCLPWQQYLSGWIPTGPVRKGLSPFGIEAVKRMNRLGIMIDAAHADAQTLRDILEHSTAPIIASHTGARSLSDFQRYLTDDELTAIANRGGLIGLWPYHHHGQGVANLDELMRHARYLADLVGAEHLCLGSDMNGVPGVMSGYRGERDVPVITAGLLAADFSAGDVRGILGENFLRVFGQIAT